MDESRSRGGLAAVLLVGALYFVVGRAFAAPVTHVQAWRLAAWVVSAAAYAAHIGYEHVRLRHSASRAALHAALAAALGAFGLAVAAGVHSALTPSPDRHPRLFALALVVWPIVTGVPAYFVALVAGAVLTKLPRSLTRLGPDKSKATRERGEVA